jgi:hypothetical protein
VILAEPLVLPQRDPPGRLGPLLALAEIRNEKHWEPARAGRGQVGTPGSPVTARSVGKSLEIRSVEVTSRGRIPATLAPARQRRS